MYVASDIILCFVVHSPYSWLRRACVGAKILPSLSEMGVEHPDCAQGGGLNDGLFTVLLWQRRLRAVLV